MTIRQLEYVVALDTHRHFVKAAESCHVAQPTLTLQVKKLEEQMSVDLFERSVKPLRPTPIGEVFITKARQILQEIEGLKEAVNADLNQMEGDFKVGVIPTLAPSLLPRFINDFLSKHPKTRLLIEELKSEQIIELIHSRQLDLGIMATPLDDPEIKEVPVFYEPFLVYADKDNVLLQKQTISKDQLKPDGLWILRQGHCFRNQTLNICEFDVSEHHRNLVMEGGSIETLKNMINEVTGYTLIPELSHDKTADAGKVLHFEAPQPVREVSIVTHRSFTKERLVSELRRSIVDHIPASFRKNDRFKTIKWR